jgi:general secretion pathway protein D
MLAATIVCLSGCQAYPRLKVEPVRLTAEQVEAARLGAGVVQTQRPKTTVKILSGTQAGGVSRLPTMLEVTPEQIAALVPDRPIKAALPPQPLAQFIDTALGQILRLPYVLGPGVAQRRDIVAARGPIAASSRQFFSMVQIALRQYGIALGVENGVVRVIADDGLAALAPAYMKTRTLPEAPATSRPVVMFKALQVVDGAPVANLLEGTFTNRGVVTIGYQESDNSIVVTGNPTEVEDAAAIIDLVDSASYAGGRIARVQPVYWQAQRLTEAVAKALSAEGIPTSTDPASGSSALMLLPITYANTVLLFSNDARAFGRALFWIEELDTPAAFDDQDGIFIYTVQNTTATELGRLISRLMAETTGVQAAEPASRNDRGERLGAVGPPAVLRPTLQPRDDGETVTDTSGRITIDPGGNRLIFRGARREFEQIRSLMIELDTPPRQVLVEVTIAEVTLTDDTRFGVEWFLQNELGGGTIVGDTRGGATRESGGLGVTFSKILSRGSVQAALSAIAENRNLNILSTPRLVARSGSEAQILVGSDVPIITSQRAADTDTEGNTDILQTVQYRQTGVILTMRPVVYGADRVDLEVFQEVSSQQPNRTSDIDSPLILNRSVTTQLSLREGMTAVIGGLMQDSYSREQRGVPLLKDIPIIGQAFRTDAVSGTKVELLLLITPYIMRSDDQMGQVASTYSGALNRLLHTRGPQVYTLLPWRSPLGTRARIHGASPLGASVPSSTDGLDSTVPRR